MKFIIDIDLSSNEDLIAKIKAKIESLGISNINFDVGIEGGGKVFLEVSYDKELGADKNAEDYAIEELSKIINMFLENYSDKLSTSYNDSSVKEAECELISYELNALDNNHIQCISLKESSNHKLVEISKGIQWDILEELSEFLFASTLFGIKWDSKPVLDMTPISIIRSSSPTSSQFSGYTTSDSTSDVSENELNEPDESAQDWYIRNKDLLIDKVSQENLEFLDRHLQQPDAVSDYIYISSWNFIKVPLLNLLNADKIFQDNEDALSEVIKANEERLDFLITNTRRSQYGEYQPRKLTPEPLDISQGEVSEGSGELTAEMRQKMDGIIQKASESNRTSVKSPRITRDSTPPADTENTRWYKTNRDSLLKYKDKIDINTLDRLIEEPLSTEFLYEFTWNRIREQLEEVLKPSSTDESLLDNFDSLNELLKKHKSSYEILDRQYARQDAEDLARKKAQDEPSSQQEKTTNSTTVTQEVVSGVREVKESQSKENLSDSQAMVSKILSNPKPSVTTKKYSPQDQKIMNDLNKYLGRVKQEKQQHGKDFFFLFRNTQLQSRRKNIRLAEELLKGIENHEDISNLFSKDNLEKIKSKTHKDAHGRVGSTELSQIISNVQKEHPYKPDDSKPTIK
ncbi:MAG: hypothetical protein P1U74_03695 [Legionellaceae bacterium]|nr:hypothetical protein [Legionellaceae bacterium]